MTLETPRTALLNMALVPVNMAVYAIHRPNFQNKGFRRTQVGFSLSGAPGTVKEYASHEIWPTAQKPQKVPNGPLKSRKYFFEKVRNFLVLDEGDCQMA